MKGPVLIYSARQNEPEHERACHIDMGRRLSCILGRRFGGYWGTSAEASRPNAHGESDAYLVATSTIIGKQNACELGVHDETGVFGGVAPHAFVPTTAIAHPLFDTHSPTPCGWSHAFSDYVRYLVPAGFTVFTYRDALAAARRLLQSGPVCIKPAREGQSETELIVTNEASLQSALTQLDDNDITGSGLTIEEHLSNATRYNIGQTAVNGVQASFAGMEKDTTDNNGNTVYGGTSLVFCRGGYAALNDVRLSAMEQLAVSHARIYDHAVTRFFPTLFTSRRHYTVACGTDAQGRNRCAVLNQACRPDGSGAAEVLALETLHARPDLNTVKAATLDLYGTEEKEPPHAIELFNGDDRDAGRIRKYVMLERYQPGQQNSAGLN